MLGIAHQKGFPERAPRKDNGTENGIFTASSTVYVESQLSPCGSTFNSLCGQYVILLKHSKEPDSVPGTNLRRGDLYGTLR